MAKLGAWICRGGAVAALIGMLADAALAQAHTPSISGNSWVAIGIIAGLVLLILLFIGGVIGISKRDTGDDDGAVGILEGIEEDDPKPRRRR